MLLTLQRVRHASGIGSPYANAPDREFSMKVLIGIDGSAGGNEAADQASRLISGKRDAVVLCYCPPELQVPPGSPVEEPVIQRTREALVRAVFDRARSHLHFDGPVEERIVEGDPRQGLLAAADACQADLIAVGARGLGTLQRLLLGSVSTTVVHAAQVPVLVVRLRPEREGADSFRVLLAYDAGKASRYALEVLGQLTWPESTVGHVMSVVPMPLAAEIPPWWELPGSGWSGADELYREYGPMKAAARQELESCYQQLPAPFQATEPIITVGDPAAEILGMADLHKSDLLVVGARRMKALGRLFLGSTSERVWTHAACSVLVVRESAEA
jgi:nucleotide-binding universal stress UspA family protein